MCVRVHLALVLVDLHSVLDLWDGLHGVVVGLASFLVILLLIELLHRERDIERHRERGRIGIRG